MAEIEFLDSPPPSNPGRPPGGAADLVEFFDALRANPGKWAKWCRPVTMASKFGVASRIKAGKFAGTERGEFKAVTRGEDVFVCYPNGSQP